MVYERIFLYCFSHDQTDLEEGQILVVQFLREEF